jgi:type II secretory pathway pseudopilin PulG
LSVGPHFLACNQEQKLNTAKNIKEHAGRRDLPRGRSSRLQAFTLVEFFGVLAVLTIAASMVVPKVFKSLDRAAWTKEVNDLTAISNAFVLQILRSNAIPSETSWAGAVANWTTRPLSQIKTNDRRYARLFFYDQGGWLNGNLPYVQGPAGTGTGIPSSARIAVVSTIAKALTNASGALSAANFNSIWNSTQGTIPSYLAGWNGNAYDLVIQRIPVDSLFHHLILTTRDPSAAARYSINSIAASAQVPTGAGGTNTYYLDGTTVGLWVNGTLTNRFLLTSDMSFTFEAGAWRNGLTGSGTDDSGTAQDFAIQAARFVSDGVPPNHVGADTQGVLSSFYDFMYAYAIWANMCPHFTFTGNNESADANYQILDSLGQNNGGGNIGIIDGASGGLVK